MSFMEKTDGQFAWEDGYKLHPSCTYSEVFMLAGSIDEWNTYGTTFGAAGANTIISALNSLQSQVSAEALWDRAGALLTPHTSTDTLKVGEGSDTVPSYSFVGNATSGMFSEVSGGKYLALAANGSEILAVSGTFAWQLASSSFDLDATDAITLDAEAASNFTVAGADLTLSTTTSGHVEIDAAERLTLNGPTYVDINSTAGGITIDAAGASNFTVAEADLTLRTTTSGHITATSADRLTLNAGSYIDLNATTAVTIDAKAASNFTVDGADLTLSTITSGHVSIDAVDRFVTTSGSYTQLNSTTTFTVNTGAGPTQRVQINADGDWDVDAKGYVLTASGSATVDATSLSFDGTLSSNLTVTGTAAVDLTLSATTSSGDARVLVSAGSEIDLSAPNLDLNATGAVTIDAVTSSNFTVTGTSAVVLTFKATETGGDADIVFEADNDITFDARGSGAVPFNESGETTLDGYSATSIVGALNEVMAAVSGGSPWKRTGTIISSVTAGDTLSVNAVGNGYSIIADEGSFVTVNASGEDLNVRALGGGAQVLAVYSEGTGTNALTVETSAGGIDVNAKTQFDLDAGGSVYIGYNADGSAGSFKINELDGADTVFQALGSGAVEITPTTNQDFTATVTGTGDIQLTSAVDVSFSGRGGAAVPFNEAGELIPDTGFTATSVVGCLNELYDSSGKSPKCLHLADRRESDGGGCQAANLWYPRRMNTALTDDLSSDLEIVEHDIATFSAGTPGSLTITGDVSALYPSGRLCDIRNSAHTNNDNIDNFLPFIVDTAVYATGTTTITFQATSGNYRNGTIVADALGTSKLTSSLFKCLTAGKYRIEASANAFGIHQTALRLVNVDSFVYNTYGGVTADGGTVFGIGMQGYYNSIPGFVTYSKVVSLVAGEHYELQQWADDLQNSSTGFGYLYDTDLNEPISHAEVTITKYDG